MINLLLRRRAQLIQQNDIDYLTFTSGEDSNKLAIGAVGTPNPLYLEYRINNGDWIQYILETEITYDKDDTIQFRRSVDEYTDRFSLDNADYYYFILDDDTYASGSVMSLIDNRANKNIQLGHGCFNFLFNDCSKLITPPSLPATELYDFCYQSMFSGCSSLGTCPELPALIMKEKCYNSMFKDCISLIETPYLPAKSAIGGCYNGMFSGCTSLTNVNDIDALAVGSQSCSSMFSGCISLEIAPKLKASSLTSKCYAGMFKGCTSIVSHDVVTLNSSNNVFENNNACETFIIRATTPPTIGSSTISGLKSDCIIYVPYSVDHSILNAYKAKQYWSARAAYMQELDEDGNIPN